MPIVILSLGAICPFFPIALAGTIQGTAIAAEVSIEFFMRFVSRIGLMPFAIYRLALAAVIVYVLI